MAEVSRQRHGFSDPPGLTDLQQMGRGFGKGRTGAASKTRFERIAEILEVDRVVWESERWEIGRIVDLLDWGVGISIYREYDPGHQVGLWFEIGPFAWWLARRVR